MLLHLPRLVFLSLPAALGTPAAARGPEAAVRLEALAERVGRFEKAELIIHLSPQARARYRNPFDPTEVDLTLEITTPGGRRCTLPAFTFQDYEQRRLKRGGRQEEWTYPRGEPHWRARFAPREVGRYSSTARLNDPSGTAVSSPASFECTPSTRRGFLRVSPHDGRFLETSDGTAFFPLGHNLAFVGYGQYLGDTRAIEEAFRKLAASGGNFARVWAGAGDWALALEWNKSAWARTWLERSPVVPVPEEEGNRSPRRCVRIEGEAVRLSPCAPVGLVPGTRYRLSGSVRGPAGVGLVIALNGRTNTLAPPPRWQNFEYEFTARPDEWWLSSLSLEPAGGGTAWVTDLSLRESSGGPELLWEADVNRPELGAYNLRDAFLLDQILEAAERTGVHLQLCLLSNPTRDLYMARLQDPASQSYEEAVAYAKRIFRYAAARWSYSPALAVWEYFNEIDPRLPAGRFYEEVGQALEELDPYRRPVTTSAWHSNPRDWCHPRLDIANEHFYLRPEGGPGWKDEVAAVLDRARFLRDNMPCGKPAFIAEFGLATEDWRQSPFLARDATLGHFHNALWASALSGLSGTAMFWWWEALDRQDAAKHYGPLAAFLEGVPFTRGNLRPLAAEVSDPRVRAVGLAGRESAYLWLFNSQAAWHRRLVEEREPEPVEGLIVTCEGLGEAPYRIRWWDTGGRGVVREDEAAMRDGTLRLGPPRFTTDLACRVER